MASIHTDLVHAAIGGAIFIVGFGMARWRFRGGRRP